VVVRGLHSTPMKPVLSLSVPASGAIPLPSLPRKRYSWAFRTFSQSMRSSPDKVLTAPKHQAAPRTTARNTSLSRAFRKKLR